MNLCRPCGTVKSYRPVYPAINGWAILERGSHPGDVVLDPFCGCGTTIDAVEKLGRDWIGIDVTQLAISLIKNRLQDTYGRRMKFISGGAHAPRVSGSTPSSNPSSVSEPPHASVMRNVASSPTHSINPICRSSVRAF